jgi:hypothetical protein
MNRSLNTTALAFSLMIILGSVVVGCSDMAHTAIPTSEHQTSTGATKTASTQFTVYWSPDLVIPATRAAAPVSTNERSSSAPNSRSSSLDQWHLE